MFPTRCLFLAALATVLSILDCVAAESSHASQPPHRLISEGTFVRGMMTADHQLGLYMALGETNYPQISPPPLPSRASASARTAFVKYPRGGGGGGTDTDESRGGGPAMRVHRAVDQAREAAVSLASVVRRRAFSTPSGRRKA
jgi:hypothetical protein